MVEMPKTVTIKVEFEFAPGHEDPTTLPSWMYEQFPAQLLGYVINGYLAGVEVGSKVATANTRELIAAQIEAMRERITGRSPSAEEARAWLSDAAALARGEEA